MEISVLARQALLYGHIIAFALAFAAIFKEDARFLRAKRIDTASLVKSAKLVKWLLLALWATGVPMVMMDLGTDVSLLLSKPKLVAKLIVVTALTVNGILLHLVAFPILSGKTENPARSATIAATLGAVSMTSWLFAFFLGASRFVAPYFSLFDFVMLYSMGLAIAIAVAVLVVRGRLERSLRLTYNFAKSPASQGYNLSVAILEAEIARLALSDIQRRISGAAFGAAARPPRDLASHCSHENGRCLGRKCCAIVCRSRGSTLRPTRRESGSLAACTRYAAFLARAVGRHTLLRTRLTDASTTTFVHGLVAAGTTGLHDTDLIGAARCHAELLFRHRI